MARYTDKKKEKDKAQRAYEFFISKGYTPEQSSGIVGNLQQESNLDEGVVSAFKGEGSFGIAQWNPGKSAGNRLGALKAFAKDRGESYGSFETQLHFIDHELNTKRHLGKSKLLAAKTVEEAALVFSENYERPSKKHANNEARAKYAKSLYLRVNDKNIYGKDERGQVVTVNPEGIDEDQLVESEKVKAEFYNEQLGLGEGENPNKESKLAKLEAAALENIAMTEKEEEFKTKLGQVFSGLAKLPTMERQQEKPYNYETPKFSLSNNEYYEAFEEGGSVSNDTDPPKDYIPSNFTKVSNVEYIDPKKEIKVDMKEVSNQVKVSEVQSLLIDKGFLPKTTARGDSNVDGKIGRRTIGALKEYQESQGLEVTGNLDTKTEMMMKLEKAKMESNNMVAPEVEYNEKAVDFERGKVQEYDKQVPGRDIDPLKRYVINGGQENKPAVVDENTLSYEEASSRTVRPEVPIEKNKALLDVRGKSASEIIEIQKELIKYGALEGNLDDLILEVPKEAEGVKEIQRKLKASGYDLGKFGQAKDGIDGRYGAKTKAALEDYNKDKGGLDGIAGEKTLAALEIYNDRVDLDAEVFKDIDGRYIPIEDDYGVVEYQEKLESQGYFKGIDYNAATLNDVAVDTAIPFKITNEKTCPSTGCTYFVNNEIEKFIKSKGREKVGAFGDAWTVSDALIRNKGKELYSIFPEQKPEIGINEIDSYMKNQIKNKSANLPKYEDINPGDVVNIYYEESSSRVKAYKEGGKYFTSHSGIVKQDENGVKYIEHNVGGTIKRELLTDMLAGKGKTSLKKLMAISAIIRPNYETDVSSRYEYYESSDVKINKDVVTNYRNLGGKTAAIYTETILKNREALQEDIPINNNEFRELTKASKVLAWKESYYSRQVDRPTVKEKPIQAVKKFAGNLLEPFGRELSRGLTQMKDGKNLTKNLRDKYIKGVGDNLNNPEEAAIPTFYALSSRYLYLRDLAHKESIGISVEELSKLSMLSWNQPLHKVQATLKRTKSYKKTMEAYREGGKLSYEGAFEAYNDYLK